MHLKSLEKKLSFIAIFLGFVAMGGSLVIGFNTLGRTSLEIQSKIEQLYLAKAKSLASLSIPEHGLTNEQVLDRIAMNWRSEVGKPNDEYICIIDHDANLILHTANPASVGRYAGDNALSPSEDSGPTTLGALSKAPVPYIGDYNSSSGEDQIAAFVPLEGRGWVLGVHRSKDLVEKSIASELRPQYLGLLAISLGIIPLALGLLYLAVLRMNKQRLLIEHNASKKEFLLEQAQTQYRELVEGTADLVTQVDLDGKIIFVNQVSSQIYGLTPEDCVGQSAFQFVYDDDKPLTKDWFDTWMASGEKSPTIENRQQNKITGEVFWMLWTAHLEYDEEGKPFAVSSIARDITHRKKVEDALKESESLKSAILENSPVGVSVRSKNGALLLANPAWQRIWNISDVELKDRLTPRQNFSFDQRDSYLGEHLEGVKNVYENGGAYYVPEVKPLIPAPGKAEWISQFFYAIQNESGEFDKVVILTEDISERKRVELDLLAAKEYAEEQEARFKALHNASFGGITIHDKGLILDCNQGLSDITGYSSDELIGMDGLKLIASHKRDFVMSQILAGYEKPYEAVGLRKNGEEYPLRLEARMIPYKSKQVRVVEFRDISEQKKAEKIRQKLEAQLRQSQKLEAVGTMVSGISHELNNVFQSMFLYGGLIKEALPDNSDILANFHHFLSHGERARDIVKQILTFSRKANIEMKPQYIHEILAEALVLQKANLPSNIKIVQNIDPDCGPVNCDKTQIHQMLINLCKNAEHAMEGKGGTLSMSLQKKRGQIREDAPELDMLVLELGDTGHGMDQNTLDKLFDPFFTTKEVGEGTGLGLSVIHGIVEMMNGSISVSSSRESGTTFRILLPVAEEMVAPAEKDEAHQNDFAGLQLLLVEDEDSIRKSTQAILSKRGFLVDSAPDGQTALQLFQQNPGKYSLIITDLSMPQLSGIELTKIIREIDPEIPILLSTGQLGIQQEIDFMEVGLSGLIQKPWTSSELIRIIKDLDI